MHLFVSSTTSALFTLHFTSQVNPGGATGTYVSGPAFPSNTIDLKAAQTVEIGYLIVNTVDAGGNELGTLDILDHSLTAELVTSEADGGTGLQVSKKSNLGLL